MNLAEDETPAAKAKSVEDRWRYHAVPDITSDETGITAGYARDKIAGSSVEMESFVADQSAALSGSGCGDGIGQDEATIDYANIETNTK